MSKSTDMHPPPPANRRSTNRRHADWSSTLTAGLCWLVIAGMIPHPIDAARANPRLMRVLQQQHLVRFDEFAAEMQELADWCEQRQLIVAAREIRAAAAPQDATALRELALPRRKQSEVPFGLAPDDRAWQVRRRDLQTRYAADVYRSCRTALRDGFPSYAFRLLREVVMHDPDHASARSILGYVEYHDAANRDPDYNGEWVTPFEKQQLSPPKREIWHDAWGWIPQSHLEYYERGQRPWQGKWISAEKEAAIRQDFNNAWEIRTEHFLVKTNVSHQRGVEIAKTLEDYHSFFFRMFAAFFETPEELAGRFSDATTSGGRRGKSRGPYPLEVHFYATRDEYNRRLLKKIPQIAITNGLYFPPDRTSYFFDDPDNDSSATLYHEATHQFFDAHTVDVRDQLARTIARRKRRRPEPWGMVDRDNFWIVEGIACYMESFQNSVSGLSLGDRHYTRFESARRRRIDDDFYVPLARLSTMGMTEFQSDSQNIAKLYAQSAGLTHFLMHNDDGRYRDALIMFLARLYRPTINTIPSAMTLAELTDTSYEELDRQYLEYLRSWQVEPAR